MRWLAKRFKYTRELEKRAREQSQEIHAHEVIENILREVIVDWEETETTFSKMTLSELEEIMSACVDYHRALRTLGAGDPVQHRILPIMEKYGIAIERNTAVDRVIDEFEERLKEKQSADNG